MARQKENLDRLVLLGGAVLALWWLFRDKFSVTHSIQTDNLIIPADAKPAAPLALSPNGVAVSQGNINIWRDAGIEINSTPIWN